jgi:hypothetical protein
MAHTRLQDDLEMYVSQKILRTVTVTPKMNAWRKNKKQFDIVCVGSIYFK